MLFETSYKEGFDNYVRVFDETTKKSKSIKVPNKYEYFIPSENGVFSYVYDKDMKMASYEGTYKDAEGNYGIFNPIDRYVRDNFWKSKKYNLNPRIFYLDIETRSGVNSKGFPKPEYALEEVCLIQIYDNIEKKMIVLGLRDFHEQDDYKTIYEYKYLKCKNEIELLETFLTIFKKLNPLIIYAWHGDGFDYPYLYNRLKNLGMDVNRLSNYGSVKCEQKEKNGNIVFEFSSCGHCFLDLKKVYQKFSFEQLPSYSLDNVAYRELKDRKIPHNEFLDFDSFYTGKNYEIADEPYEDRVREEIRQCKIKCKPCDDLLQFMFVWYGMQDVYLMKRIDDKRNLTSILTSIAQEMGCTFDDAMKTVRPWSIGLQNIFYAEKIVCPKKEEHDNPNVVGGFVKEPIVGIHSWLLNFDVNSMYPMLSIKGHNMSPDTLIPTNKLPSDLREHVLKYFNDQNEQKLLEYDDSIWNKTKELLKKYDVSLGINGSVFSHEHLGDIPKKVAEIYYGRKDDKKKMLKYEAQIELIKKVLQKR